MPTPTTLPLIIMIFWLWHITKQNLIAVVLFTSIFEAASAINFGNLGISPSLFSLALCIILRLLSGHRQYRISSGHNKSSVILISLFILYSLWTGIAYPFFFRGIPVMHGGIVTPLSWSVANFAQICYLLASVFLYFIVLTYSNQELVSAIEWYVRACIAASFIAFYQLSNAIFHVPYPDAILYSNPSHVIYRAYTINGMWRLNSTFSEASEFSAFITVGIGLLAWNCLTRPFVLSRYLYLSMMLLSLIMTESSLGYACLIYTVIVGSFLYAVYSYRKKGIPVSTMVLSLLLAVSITVVVVSSDKAIVAVEKIVTSTLIDKKSSQSYYERTLTHDAAIETLQATYYMGAGWGSVRASGLTYILLGNVGLIGFILFGLFYLSLFIPGQRPTYKPEHDLFVQCLFASSIMLLGLCIAGAEPVQPILWVLFGIATTRGGRTIANTSSLTTASTQISQTIYANCTPNREILTWCKSPCIYG